MEAAAAYQEFRRLKATLPFQPFVVETVDGKNFQINRRSGFAAGKQSVVLGDADARGHVYRLADVTNIRASEKPPVAS